MKKLLVTILTILILLAGCTPAQEDQPTEDTYPTLPTINVTLTPEDHLKAAFDGLQGLDFSVSYGSGWLSELTLKTEKVADAAEDLRSMVPNEGFLKAFSKNGMTAVPSKSGTMTYETTELTVEQICQILCGRELNEEEQDALSKYGTAEGSIRIIADAGRLFQSLTVEIQLDESLWAIRITVSR